MEWDVFISHASEDKKDLVKSLAMKLNEFNLNVWYDEFTLTVGDSLSRSIDKGLANSKYGIVVLSEDFINKHWTEYEYRGLVSREIGMDKVILPIWHNIDKEQLLKYSPTLADKFALNTQLLTLDEIAYKLLEVIKPEIYEEIMRVSYLNYLKKVAPKETINIEKLDLKIVPRHETLPNELVSRIAIIHNVFFEVLPAPFESTLENFKRDNNPENEIIIWESMAATYLEYTRNNTCSIEMKKEVFSLILHLSLYSNNEVEFQLKCLSNEEAANVVRLYNNFKPIYDTTIPVERFEN